MRRTMKHMQTLIFVGVLALGAGCCHAAGSAYQQIDLTQNLRPATLQRYRDQALAGGDDLHCATNMKQLEYSNNWLLGLIAYWRKGNAMLDLTDAASPRYMVSESTGWAPLAVLRTAETTSTFDLEGRRLNTAQTSSWLWGHLYMAHTSEQVEPDGTLRTMRSRHIFHHLFNIHQMDGHTRYSLLSIPNPLEIEVEN